ncbi:MAG: DUF885 domain-containing protein [Gammaproteobacteria bacterium]|nr:DUF885 domain-containing protein [Gammaproteobacteria bacterium]
MRLALTCLFLLACLTGCESPDDRIADDRIADERIDAFFAEFTSTWIRANPDMAVRSGYFSGAEQDSLEQQLTPRTRAFELEVIGRARDGLLELEQYVSDDLGESRRTSAAVMRWQLETIVAAEPFLDYWFPLNQYGGTNVRLPNQLTVVHPVNSASDAENYVVRMREIDTRMNEATAESARRSRESIRPPRFIVQLTIEQMERFLASPPEQNPLVTTLRDKSLLLMDQGDLDADTRDGLIDAATNIVATEVYPAWRAGVAELRSQLPLTNDDAGLWRFEDGAEAYAYRLRRFTTTNLSADEIHEIGLAEVARIESEMDRLLKEVGLAEGTVENRVAELEVRLAYPDTDEGRERLMARINELIVDAESRAEPLFNLRPKTPVIAQPYPRFRWDNAPASYLAPALDGSRPGVFQMPLRKNRLTDFALRSLVYHETIPGHHFQLALVTSDPDLPDFFRTRALGGISANSEGWALYAERLAAESGWYDGDIEGRIGQLDSALFRARRLDVDTGLHAKRWTRQQAIDYGISSQEVERYVMNPGQACSYMIGRLKLVELRERAREALGDRFSIQEFHDVVLKLGIVPLTIVEDAVDRYIDAGK